MLTKKTSQNKKFKISLYSDYGIGLPPYGGGGEVYAINLASELAKNHKITIFSNKVRDEKTPLKDVFKFYGIDDEVINKIKFKSAPYIGWKLPRRIYAEIFVHLYLMPFMIDCDLFINCSDSTMHGFSNSIIKTPSIKVIHFPWMYTSDYVGNKIKHLIHYVLKDWRFSKSYDYYMANSMFTSGWVKNILRLSKVDVLYPPIKMDVIDESDLTHKENIILYTGRIIAEKKCLELSRAFVSINKQFPDWKFIIAGNFKPGDEKYMEKVKEALKGSNYEIILDVPQDKFISIYKKAKIFWNAKGLDAHKPLDMEHFGMTTVEAMSNGCVPVVINKAGQAEIVNDLCGYRWDNLDELEEQTTSLINDDNLRLKLAKAAIKRSKDFSVKNYVKKLHSYFDKLF